MSKSAEPEQIVYVVDDDEAMRDSAAWLLESRGFRVRTLESAEAFLEIYGPALTGCLILDVRMPGMSGLELFEKLRQTADRAPLLPVIFVTGHGDVPMAVGALKHGAADFIEKPFNDLELVRLVEQSLARERAQRARHRETQDDRRRLDSLTEREKEVMRLIVAGRLNKQIADDLGISIKTVEVHRARVMEKMDVRAVAELVQAVMRTEDGGRG